MIRQFEKLSVGEIELLLHAPVLISVLATTGGNHFTLVQPAAEIRSSHLSTFTPIPLLGQYYAQVERGFESRFETAFAKYARFSDGCSRALKDQVEAVNPVLDVMNTEFGDALQRSLLEYSRHVRRAPHCIYRDYVFPLALQRLTL